MIAVSLLSFGHKVGPAIRFCGILFRVSHRVSDHEGCPFDCGGLSCALSKFSSNCLFPPCVFRGSTSEFYELRVLYCCRIVHGRNRAQRSWWHANTARMLLPSSFLMHRCSFESHTTRSSLVGCSESRWLSRTRHSVNLPRVAILFRSLCDCTISVFPTHPLLVVCF